MNDPESSIFPIYDGYMLCYLQLFVDLIKEKLYDDVGVFAYGPNENGALRKFNPVRDNIYFNLYPDSLIELQQDVGC